MQPQAYDFKINGKVRRITREQVIEALDGVKPARLRTHAVSIGGTRYPIKQAFAAASGLDHADFGTQTARRAFMRMGFPLYCEPRRPRGVDVSGRPSLKPDDEFEAWMSAETELLAVAIHLLWSWWEWWDDIRVDDMRGQGVEIPHVPGVYEVKLHEEDERLYIGRASNLMMRVKYGLVDGSSAHSAGRKIRRDEDLSHVCVRWSDCDRPAAAEEELHRRHILKFGHLPKYAERT